MKSEEGEVKIREEGERVRRAYEMDKLGLSSWMVSACRKLRLVEPFPIQKEVVPRILKGENVIGCAATGRGKTAAFVLPLLDLFAREPRMFFAIVVAPTHELASQINNHFLSLGEAVGLKTTLAIGGIDITRQQATLERGVHVVIGTPGRIVDHILNPSLSRQMKLFSHIVFDECDRMLIDPMSSDVKAILHHLSPRESGREKTINLFSATLNKGVEEYESFFGKKFTHINLLTKGHGVGPGLGPGLEIETSRELLNITHKKIECVQASMHCILYHLLSHPSSILLRTFKSKTVPQAVKDTRAGKASHNNSSHTIKRKGGKGIIFVTRILDAELVARMLRELDFDTSSLHAEKSHGERFRSLADFREDRTQILVATDVASRGLDIPKVDWVINLNVPLAHEDFVHRVGRCARAGREGVSITFVVQVLIGKDAEKDVMSQRMTQIEQTGVTVEPLALDLTEVMKSSLRIAKATAAAKNSMNKNDFGRRLAEKDRRRKADDPKKAKKKGKKGKN